jgi:hypothetical protein
MWWAALHYDGNDESVLPALRQWYYSPTVADEMRGDIPLESFDNHVRCVFVPLEEDEHDVFQMEKWTTLCPTRDALLLFFSKRQVLSQLYVLGALTCMKVCQLHGNIPFSVLRASRSRLFSLENTVTLPSTTSVGTLFYFGLSTVESDGTYAMTMCARENTRGDISFDTLAIMLKHRVEWYMGIHSCVVDMEPNLDYMTRVAACIVGDVHTYYGREEVRHPYDTLRMRSERQLFWQRMQTHQTVASIVQLMKFNGLHSFIRQRLVNDPSAIDVSAFRTLYPHAAAPALFFYVPLINLPAHLTTTLPIYRGGRIRLPCYWECVAEWIWTMTVTEWHHRHTTFNHTRIHNALKQGEPILSLIHDVARMVIKSPKNNMSHVMRTRAIAPNVEFTDIEDLASSLPGCMQFQSEFPRHAQRKKLVATMVQAGVAEADMQSYFELLNARFPKDKNQPNSSLEARPFFLSPMVKSYGGIDVWCKQIITDTLRNERDSLHCPHVVASTTTTTTNIDTIKVACNHACMGRMFGGKPANALKMTLTVKQHQKATKTTTATPVVTQKGDLLDSNSDDDDDDSDEAYSQFAL